MNTQKSDASKPTTDRLDVEVEHKPRCLVVNMGDHDRSFVGRWLVEPGEDSVGERGPRHLWWGVAVTARDQIAVYVFNDDDNVGHLEVYPTIHDARYKLPWNIFAAAADELGERATLELDI